MSVVKELNSAQVYCEDHLHGEAGCKLPRHDSAESDSRPVRAAGL